MWDADTVARVRDRKLNEIMVFASLAKIDRANLDEYIDIIVSLGDDIDACDILLDTEGAAEIELDSIDSALYNSRLSDTERADEESFNSLKSSPSESETSEEADIGDYVRRLLMEAVESIRADDGRSAEASEALQAVKDELSGCRRRVEQLSQDLEYARNEAATLEEELKELRDERRMLIAQVDDLKSKNASLRIDLNLAEQKLSVLEPAFEEMQSAKKAPEPEAKKEEPVAEAPAAGDDSYKGKFLSNESIDTIRRVKAMKDSKIDETLEAYEKGEIDVDVCDDIVGFLKTDVAICDALLGIDFTVKASVVAGFKRIIEAVKDSEDPKHQDEYVHSLTEDEASLEYSYSRVVNSLQGMMMYMRDEIVD
ncbi:MAG: hypothetical protein Q4Q58_00630 [Thermoplasmata archaeon]|nr:hypothetical protein [Thermoplasmata archaeon]